MPASQAVDCQGNCLSRPSLRPLPTDPNVHKLMFPIPLVSASALTTRGRRRSPVTELSLSVAKPGAVPIGRDERPPGGLSGGLLWACC